MGMFTDTRKAPRRACTFVEVFKVGFWRAHMAIELAEQPEQTRGGKRKAEHICKWAQLSHSSKQKQSSPLVL